RCRGPVPSRAVPWRPTVAQPGRRAKAASRTEKRPLAGTAAAPLEGRRRMGPRSYWLPRFALLRLLGRVYVVASLSPAQQVLPLIGHDGLLPADAFLDRVAAH